MSGNSTYIKEVIAKSYEKTVDAVTVSKAYDGTEALYNAVLGVVLQDQNTRDLLLQAAKDKIEERRKEQ